MLTDSINAFGPSFLLFAQILVVSCATQCPLILSLMSILNAQVIFSPINRGLLLIETFNSSWINRWPCVLFVGLL